MTIHAQPQRALGAARQRGQAMLLTVLLLAVGVAGVVYTLATPGQITIENDKKTAAALAQARDALIGYAAVDNRPGSLPCPDLVTNNPIFNNIPNDGSADQFSGNECDGYAGGNVYIGRLPWKTLKLPDLRDGSGERLWYAVSRDFARSSACTPPTCPAVNSDTAGQITISGGPSQVIAVIFSPGAVLGAQTRGTANENAVANYLEGGNEAGAATATLFTSSAASFNDKLLPITSDALFNVVNIRVAKEAIAALETYRAVNGYYPFANSYGSGAPYNCVTNLLRGRFPITLTGCAQDPWGAALPAWFSANNWNLVTHYASSKSCGQMSGLLSALSPILCGLAANIPLLTVPPISTLLALLGLSFTEEPLFVTGITGINGARTLVIVTGRGDLFGQAHPCVSDNQCMEDAANTDTDAAPPMGAGAAPGRYTYSKPSRFPASNDRMAISCDAASFCPVIP